MKKKQKRFLALSDADLLDLLYTAADRLPREAIDEILRRGRRMVPLLREIVSEKASWTEPLPEWWAAVHATYALGAMENSETLPALLLALRWADAFDCDWVTEDLPSMFGRIGPDAYEPLRLVALDATAGYGARSIALYAMTAIAFRHPYLAEEVTVHAAGILSGPVEDVYLRQTAANVLIDFRATAHRESLHAFGREEARRKQDDPEYRGVFYDWEVDDLLDEDGGQEAIEYYQRDWLAFYDPEEIEQRQERWAKEQEENALEESRGQPPPRDLSGPCACGSGKPFDRCCYLKVH